MCLFFWHILFLMFFKIWRRWKKYKKTWDIRSLTFYNYLLKSITLICVLDFVFITNAILNLKFLNKTMIYLIIVLNFYQIILLFDLVFVAIFNRIFFKIKFKKSFFDSYEHYNQIKLFIRETLINFFLKIFGEKITIFFIDIMDFFFYYFYIYIFSFLLAFIIGLIKSGFIF